MLPRARAVAHRSAFTIVELLVVIIIIGVLLSILVPTIAGVRQTAKRAKTQTIVNGLATASNSFMNDRKGIAPGYFPALTMGDPANMTRGFSAMQNVMLDLAGGIVLNEAVNNGSNQPCDETTGPSVVEVGPTAAITVKVNLGLIGASSKDLAKGAVVNAYYTPDRANFVRQCGPGQRLGGSAPVGHLAMPEVTDDWGNPILAWSKDERANDSNPFAAIDSSAGPASFYYASNIGILAATSLGKSGKNHAVYDINASYSMIGAATPPDRLASGAANPSSHLEALLGNPAFPIPTTGAATIDHPARARGSLIFHSAGNDGWFLGSEDRGGKMTGAVGDVGRLRYVRNVDPIANFDDIMVSAIN